MAGPDIFLSYNREDAEVAKLFADAFAREGMEVWWDVTLRSGETYDEVTEAALRGAKAVVVLWSPRSIASHWVRSEATIAHRAKTLVPATIEPCDKPVMFELTQTADLSHWRGEAEDKAWQTFLGDVRRMIGHTGSDKLEAVDQAASTQSSDAGAPSIVAVLPLAHRAGDEEMEILAEDVTEDITRELARNRFFKVIAAGTMAAWRGKRADHYAIARETRARYIVEGKLQRAGEDVRLTVQLVETELASVLMSERIVRKADDLAADPEELARAVASELGDRINDLEVKRSMTKQGRLTGWDYLLRAVQATIGGPSTFDTSVEEARKAVALAPDLGQAHAQLAGFLAARHVSLGHGPLDETTRREIHEHMKRALLLDGDNPLIVMGLVSPYAVLGDYETALRQARRAVELDPGSPHTLFALARAHHMMGRTSEAIDAFNRQLEVSHRSADKVVTLHLLAICLCVEGKLDEAEAAIDQALTLAAQYSPALVLKAVISAMQGQEAVARSLVMQLREAEPELSGDQHLGYIINYPLLHERAGEIVETFRRLWDATEGEAKST